MNTTDGGIIEKGSDALIGGGNGIEGAVDFIDGVKI